MPEWLTEAVSIDTKISAALLATRLGLALAFGVIVALVYRSSHGKGKSDAAVLTTTLVLLTVLIAMVTLVIGNSVARAFSLVGALSIVRFRTVVDDTRDTAFVIFAVVVGMAVGTGFLLVPLIGIPIVSVAAIALDRRGRSAGIAAPADCVLQVRLGLGRDPDPLLADALARHVEASRIMATGTARQGAALDVTYSVRLRPESTMTAFVTELNRIEGVQNVELRHT